MERLTQNLKALILGSSLLALVLKAIGAAANFAMAVVITQKMGAEVAAKFYIYTYAAVILSVFVRMGMDNVILRQIAQGGEGVVFHTLQRAFSNAFSCSLLGLAAGLLVAFCLPVVDFKDVLIVCTIGFTWSLTQLVATAFKGLGRNAMAAFFDAIPVSSVLIVAVMVGLQSGDVLIYMLVGLQAAALIIALWLVYQQCKFTPIENPEGRIHSYDYMVVDGLNMSMLWLPFFVVAAVWGDVAASNLNIVIKLVMVGNLFIAVFNGITAKRVTKLLSHSRTLAALKAARLQTLYALVWVFPVTCAVLAAGYQLNLYAGIHKQELLMAMGFLLLAQFINIVTGPVEVILAMARKSRCLLSVTLISFMVSAVALSIFVWHSPLVGAALSILAGVTAFNLISANKVKQELGGFVFPRFYGASSSVGHA